MSFDHLDIKRKSTRRFQVQDGGGGCPPVLLAPQANGWTHSNALEYIPSSGNFLVSVPEQDWVVKVDWRNGKGSGKVLWRLGNGGDFKVESGEKDSWFSFAHDVGYEPDGSGRLTDRRTTAEGEKAVNLGADLEARRRKAHRDTSV